MKLIVAGSREFNDYPRLKQAIDQFPYPDLTIISGGARGADKLGERYAREHVLQLEIFPADWNKHGKSAGYIRNEQMAKASDTLIAFWDGKSRGTKHMIDLANKHGLKVYLEMFDY